MRWTKAPRIVETKLKSGTIKLIAMTLTNRQGHRGRQKGGGLLMYDAEADAKALDKVAGIKRAEVASWEMRWAALKTGQAGKREVGINEGGTS